MKLIVLLTMICCLKVSASLYAQKISIDMKNVPIENVFDQIKKQSGYTFWYIDNVLSPTKKVTLKFKDLELVQALEQSLKDQPLSYEIMGKIIVISSKAPERESVVIQEKEIKGIIQDERGKPMPDASIKIKNSNRRTAVSGSDGRFRIMATENETLVITYVGYKPRELSVKNINADVVIKMEPQENQMNEVTINTGMFRKVDKSFTGSSVTVTREELQQFGSRNLITSLRNLDPSFNVVESNAFGSDPNRLPEITLRGNSSLPNVGELQDQTRVGLNTPLIILDGFQSTLQKLLDINENEVETITILKDAAATAMYGSRGSNGVIVITTRSPKAGKLRLSFRTLMNVELADLSDYNLLKAKDKLELERRAGYYNNARAESDLPLKRYYNYILNEINSGVETDWMAIPLNTAIGQRHNLSLEGGDQAFRYSASAQLNDQQGVMIGSNRRTFNGGITLQYTYKNVRFRNNLQISEGRSNESPYGSFSEYTRLNPYWRPYDEKGNVIKQLGNPGNSDYTGFWSTLPANPLYNATLHTINKTGTSNLVNNTSVEWTVIKDLVLRGQIGLNKTTGQTDVFRPAEHTAFANYATSDFFRKGDYRYGISNAFGYDASLNLSYSRSFNVKHVLFGGLDYNVLQNKSSSYSFVAEGFPNANFDFVSMALQYAKDGKPTGSEALTRSIGFTGNVNYTYDNRYFADASVRVDGSSQFGANKRFAPFWSAGLGWNIHNEKFMQDNKVVNRLKLRGSMGITGSQNFNAYQALSTYAYYTNDRYYNWLGSYLMGLGNEDLQWQQTMKYNGGIDAEFLNRRLKLTADYYEETTQDLVSTINLPASNGFTTYIENIGSMRNKGYEVKATFFILSNPGNVSWSVTGAIMHNKNKIISTSAAYRQAQQNNLSSATTIDGIYIQGYSTNTIWAVPSLGIDPSTGKELFLGKDGLPTYTWKASDVAAVGVTDPKISGNFSSMLNYKNFIVNASFGYKFGGQQYNQTLVNKVEGGNYRYNVDARVFESRWQYPGDMAAFKGILITTATSKTSRFVQDENTLRLQNISLKYDFRGKKFLKGWGLEALNVGADMADVFYLSTIRRERGTNYPFSKQFSLNLTATF